MSRTIRVGPVDGFWVAVDAWAADVVEPNRLSAWRNSRCQAVAASGRYLDVIGELEGLPLPARRLDDAVGRRGTAFPAEDAVRDALVEAGILFREVTRAQRFRWTGPALTPVLLEVHTTADEAVVEAWWEDVWAAWPTIRLGRESQAEKPPRRAGAVAQISRLLAALEHDPLTRPD